MAYAGSPTTRTSHGPVLGRIRSALLEIVDTIATAGPKSEALRRLTRMTDAQLAARGTTRDAEVRRILGVYAYL